MIGVSDLPFGDHASNVGMNLVEIKLILSAQDDQYLAVVPVFGNLSTSGGNQECIDLESPAMYGKRNRQSRG